jgi:hypothetical protein
VDRRLPCLLILAVLAGHAAATDLTLYRSDNDALYAASGDGAVDDGYAVVHEPRTLTLKAGVQDLSLDGLPRYLDAEALALNIQGGAKVLAQRLRLAQGQNAALAALVGRHVEVRGAGGATTGTLVRADDGLVVRSDGGATTVIHAYDSITAAGELAAGTTLDLRVDAPRAGQAKAVLSYPTSGLGWRAAYVGTLQPGAGCRLLLESRASIANRSGRDWQGVRVKLIAGEPNTPHGNGPRPVMMMARAAKASAPLPEQSTLADYRSYALPAAIDLPDGSVSQTPLYAPRTLDCQRTALLENGNAWRPAHPNLAEGDAGGAGPIVSTLHFKAFDSLPAGGLRVLSGDRDGLAEFVGAGRVADTPKGQDVDVALGNVFDLSAQRERTAFKLDKPGRRLDEAYRIVLANAGASPRTVTVREHPGRWRQWTLASSSTKATRQTPDTLEFQVEVPAGGQATLDYAVRYDWTAQDE